MASATMTTANDDGFDASALSPAGLALLASMNAVAVSDPPEAASMVEAPAAQALPPPGVLRCGVLDGTLVEVADAERRATFAIAKFVLVGVELIGCSAAEFEVVESELLETPIDPDLVQGCRTVSDALAVVATNASNFACVRLHTVWRKEGRTADLR